MKTVEISRRKMIRILIIMLLCLMWLFTGGKKDVQAAELDIPEVVRVIPGTWRQMTVRGDDENYFWGITNIKTDSKDMRMRGGADYSLPEQTIKLYARKSGEYKISFDIYEDNDEEEIVSSHTIRVIAAEEVAVKSVTLGKKRLGSSNVFTVNKTQKLKVKMNKGYKLQKLEVITFKKNGSGITKTQTVKNGAGIKLGQYSENTTAGKYSKSSGSVKSKNYYWYKQTGIPKTMIRITYLDKYSGESLAVEYEVFLF